MLLTQFNLWLLWIIQLSDIEATHSPPPPPSPPSSFSSVSHSFALLKEIMNQEALLLLSFFFSTCVRIICVRIIRERENFPFFSFFFFFFLCYFLLSLPSSFWCCCCCCCCHLCSSLEAASFHPDTRHTHNDATDLRNVPFSFFFLR